MAERARKKPVEIEFMRFEGRQPFDHNGDEVAAWCGGTCHRPAEMDDDGWTSGDAVVDIKTLEGTMRASLGDLIIRGVEGEFYPCKPEIFAATYDVLGPAPSAGSTGEDATDA